MERRLARGLEALLGKGGVQAAATQSIQTIPVDAIRPNPRQPRRDLNAASLIELEKSISRDGLLQPIVVRRTEDGYEIIAGERRWRACKSLGLPRIPALVRSVEHDQQLVLALVENLQRTDLNAIDEAMAFQQLLSEFGMTHEEVAKRVGKERSTVSNALRLLELPLSGLEAVSRGTLTAGHARALIPLAKSPRFEEVLQKTMEEGWSVRQTERVVRELVDGPSGSTAGDEGAKAARTRGAGDARPAAIVDLEDRLRTKWGTQVRITAKRRGGEVAFLCASREELDYVLERLGSAIWQQAMPIVADSLHEAESNNEMRL
ncbi:MAG: ParB/RepB/Spo0J family partition protein [Planctomycetes bacterium]|nr:ParB/RepB/Spo0J family partition protein [Planctomycetota bacterium]